MGTREARGEKGGEGVQKAGRLLWGVDGAGTKKTHEVTVPGWGRYARSSRHGLLDRILLWQDY